MTRLWARFAMVSIAINWFSILLALLLITQCDVIEIDVWGTDEVDGIEENYDFFAELYISEKKYLEHDKHKVLKELAQRNLQIWDAVEHQVSTFDHNCSAWQVSDWSSAQCMDELYQRHMIAGAMISMMYNLWHDSVLQGIALLSFVISLFAGGYFAWYLKKPIESLVNATKKISQGEVFLLEDKSKVYEVSKLIESFNEMMDRIQVSEKKHSRLLADVSHELRIPLCGLECVLRAALDRVVNLNDKSIASLHSQIAYIIRIVNDLSVLSLSKAQKLLMEKQYINFIDTVKESIEFCRIQAAAKKITIDSSIEDSQVFLLGDKYRIQQVFNNVLNNSIVFTPVQGRIMIDIVKITKQVTISVKDTGAGISKEDLPHVFDSFYRAKRADEQSNSTGLGLAIAKSIVQLHGGRIAVYSAGSNQGTQVDISFPVTQKAAQALSLPI